MKSILSFVFLFTIFGIKAQNNMVVFTENGEKFFLIVNGVKQNIESETDVKVTDLPQPNYKIKIVFEDQSKGVVDHNVYFMDGGVSVTNYEFVYGVKINKKAGYKVHPVSAVSLTQAKADPSQTVVHYATSEPTTSNNNVISDGTDNSTGVNVSTATNDPSNNVQVNQTVTQTQTSNGNTNVGLNVNGMGVNVNTNGMGMNTTTSQTVTTTSSTSGNTGLSNNNTSMNNSNTSYGQSSSMKNSNANPLPGYTGAIGCPAPINGKEFGDVKTSISSKSFEDSKITMAKQVIDNNCLLSSQVKEIMELFSFEETRLDLAKYAYGHTYDIGNYYKLNDAFSFESSINDLDKYIKANKK